MSSDDRIHYDAVLGCRIEDVIHDAIGTAQRFAKQVYFNFNGVEVTVEATSSPSLIYRDWSRTMKGYVAGDKVGPQPPVDLDAETLANDARIEAEIEADVTCHQAEYEVEQAVGLAAVTEKLASVPPLELSDKAGWDKSVEVNKADPYSAAVLEYAENWGRLMQKEIGEGHKLVDIADRCSHEADKGIGITGFMYGCAVSILSQTWVHGEDLRRWHNKEYDRPDAEGVINPALLTIG